MMFWMNGWKLGETWWANAVAVQETLVAAQGVVAHRRPILETAMRQPLEADLPELYLMSTEKIDAFGKANMAMAQSWFDLSRQMMAQAHDIGSLMVSGWPPRTRAMERIERRGTALALGAGTAAGRAIAPIHAAATANQRRLGRAGKKARR